MASPHICGVGFGKHQPLIIFKLRALINLGAPLNILTIPSLGTLYYLDSAKAASEGSVLWAIRKSVVARATRFAFGVDMHMPTDAITADRFGRRLIKRYDGSTAVAGKWSEIVPKVPLSFSRMIYLLTFKYWTGTCYRRRKRN